MTNTEIWNEEKIEYLREHYADTINDELAIKLSVTVDDIRRKAKSLKLKKSDKGKKITSWSKEDVQTLKDNYDDKTVKELVVILNNKFTEIQIRNKVIKLNLKKGNTWTDELIQYLKDNCGELSIQEMKDDKLKDFSEKAIYKKMYSLGLSDSDYYQWTEEDIEIMKKFYPLKTNKELQEEFFPELSLDKIKSKGKYLGLKKLDIVSYKARCMNTNPDIWTDEEKALLIEHYGKMTNKELQMFYLPDRTIEAIKKQASKLGVYNRLRYDYSWHFSLVDLEETDDISITLKVEKITSKEEGEPNDIIE